MLLKPSLLFFSLGWLQQQDPEPRSWRGSLRRGGWRHRGHRLPAPGSQGDQDPNLSQHRVLCGLELGPDLPARDDHLLERRGQQQDEEAEREQHAAEAQVEQGSRPPPTCCDQDE